MQRKQLQTAPKALATGRGLLGLLLAACMLFASACEKKELDTLPPVFSGVKDIEITAGEGIAFRDGVQAIDDRDGAVEFTVDASAVAPDTPGSYTVIYRASDQAGNEAVERITVTVKPRLTDPALLWELLDPIIRANGWGNMSLYGQCEAIYWYTKNNLSYTSSSEKGDYIGEALRALQTHQGDCFTYYALARAIFERLGVEVMTVQRAPGVLPTTHYWLLINTGSADVPAWYHWDSCPHPMAYPLQSILLTDAEVLAYNQKVEHYYTFEQDKYPATPTESYQR